jgi:hypothetical protein
MRLQPRHDGGLRLRGGGARPGRRDGCDRLVRHRHPTRFSLNGIGLIPLKEVAAPDYTFR